MAFLERPAKSPTPVRVLVATGSINIRDPRQVNLGDQRQWIPSGILFGVWRTPRFDFT